MSEKRPSAVPTIQVKNDRVVVTEWCFPPNGETGWHKHQHDYVVVPQTNGKLLLENTDGEVTADLVSGQAYYRDKGVEHNVVNPNDFEFVFVETEVL